MARPAVAPTTEVLFAALGVWADADGEDTAWSLLHLAEALVGGDVDDMEAVIRDTDDGPGWSHVLHADRAPVEWLPWLGQFVGVDVDESLTELGKRTAITESSGFKRGTVEAVRGAARTLLTGNQTVELDERDTSPYHFTISTYTAETPGDGSTVEAAIRRAKPGGLQFTYVLVDGIRIDQIEGTIDAQAGTIDDYASQVP